METVNDFELRARRERARKLADAYYCRAIDACRQADWLTDRAPRAEYECADDVLAMAHDATMRVWVNLAVSLRLSLPSTKTMGLAQSLVVDRARVARRSTST